MKATVLSVTGWEEAITAVFMSKRTWTPELGAEIREVVANVISRYGEYCGGRDFIETNAPLAVGASLDEKFENWSTKVLKWGTRHNTLLRYLDITIMTEGMHRAGQDDIDAHARRFDNRIIRNSTRATSQPYQTVSEFYQGKIMTDGEAAKALGFELPDKTTIDGEVWVKTTNGYVKEAYVNNNDVTRGLYMLAISSNFISKINLCEWGHVFKERCNEGGANPEVKRWAEMVTEQLAHFHPLLTRDYVLSIKN